VKYHDEGKKTNLNRKSLQTSL